VLIAGHRYWTRQPLRARSVSDIDGHIENRSGDIMTAAKAKEATGYPPLTAAEEKAAGTVGTDAGRIGSDDKILVDAMAAVFDDHRRRIDAAAIDPEAKRYVLDLLDAVFLDLLQSVLNQSPVLELTPKRRRTAL
jgi:hypothetical protein